MMLGNWARGLAVVAVVASLSGCTSSRVGGSSGTPTTSASSTAAPSDSLSTSPTSSSPVRSSSSATADPRGKAATTAYIAFTNASNNAARKPSDMSREDALKAHSVDPALAQEGKDLFNYRRFNIEFRGHPPTSRVAVRSISVSGSYPTVTLTDCPNVSTTWRPYSTTTGKPLKLVKPKVAPPWATTATVIYYKGHWSVQTQEFDKTRTCTP